MCALHYDSRTILIFLLLVAQLLLLGCYSTETSRTNYYRVDSFEDYSDLSLQFYEDVIVFLGILADEADHFGRQQRELRLYKSLAEKFSTEDVFVKFVWTPIQNSRNTGLSSLFPQNSKVYVFNRRDKPFLSEPTETFTAETFDENVMNSVEAYVRELLQSKPSSRRKVFDEKEAGTYRYLLDYSRIDRQSIERKWNTINLTDSLCRGQRNCEIERRSNISSEEFVEQYFLWGRPVIITDAMKDWNLEKLGSYQSLTNLVPSFKTRRKASNSSQLLNVLIKEEQKELRKHYSLPYFLRFPRGNTSLDTELFFFGEPGAKGLDFHLDTGCHPTYWVAHLQGVKKWTFRPILTRELAIKMGIPPAFQFPTLTATLHPGEILVFYSGWWHRTDYDIETSIPGNPTISFTMYAHRPLPKFYLDTFRHWLITRKEYSGCLDTWYSADTIVGNDLDDDIEKVEDPSCDYTAT